MPSSQKPSIETKLRALKQILCDIDRYQQKARPPVPVNTKGAKSVLGIREHQNRIKKLKATKSFNLNEHFKQQQPSLWRKCTNYYHDLIKQRNRKPDKLKTDTKRQQDLIVQQYQRMRRRHQRTIADDKIDEEYERLQKKFCPSFQLNKPLPPPKFAVKRKHILNKAAAKTANAKLLCSRSTYNMSNNITRSNMNLKKPLDLAKQNKGSSLVVANVSKVDAKLDLKQRKQTKADLKKSKNVTANKEMKMNSIKDPKDTKQSQVKSMTATKELKQDQKKSFPLTKQPNENEDLSSDDSDRTLTPENEHRNVEKDTPSKATATVQQPDVNKYRITALPQKTKPQSNDALNNAIGKPFEKSVKTCQEINCALMNKLFYNKINNNIISNSSSISNNNNNNNNNASETYNLKYKEVEIRREIRDAIEEGKSTDPLVNNLLANVIYKAQREHVPWSSVKTMIDNFKMTSTRKKVLHLLQIQLRHSVFIICTVRTSNFSKLLYTLDKAMRPLNAKFASILQHFTHCCVIEAIVPNKYRGLNLKELRKRLDKQVETLNLKRIDIVDAGRGEIAIQCLPVDMPNISRAFEVKGYKILNSDYGFRANKEIILDTRTAAEYRRLMNFLKDIPDIETITDNVIY